MRIMLQRLLLLPVIMLSLTTAQAQQTIREYSEQSDSLAIGKNGFLRYQPKGFTLFLPKGKARAVIVSLDERPFNGNDTAAFLHPAALRQDLALLYVSTGVPVDLFDEGSVNYADSILTKTFNKYSLPKDQLLFLGVNLSGHRAMRFLRHQRGEKWRQGLKGMIFCDGVLDWVRQWYEEKKAVRDAFAESSVFEGEMVTYLLETAAGGSPKEQLSFYLGLSAYSYFDEENAKLEIIGSAYVRAYTEPSTEYWMNEKGKGVFDTNFPDMVGIITELKLRGNKNATLTIFDKPRSPSLRRNPDATWKLVDKKELVEWMITALPAHSGK